MLKRQSNTILSTAPCATMQSDLCSAAEGRIPLQPRRSRQAIQAMGSGLTKSSRLFLLLAAVSAALLLCAPAAWSNPNYTMADFSSMPVSITEDTSTPQVQINASNDHQLFFKAYNDYGDLDDDNIPETTYKHSVNYYGYFDNYKCYSYSYNSSLSTYLFTPKHVTADKYCGVSAGEWSGNFLNWVAMTRIDTIRKILFGGHRRIDTSSDTILERAFIPPDIHAFAKFYNHTDLPRLTPFDNSIVSVNRNSASSVEIGSGSKTFAVATPDQWNQIGDYVIASDTSNSNNYVAGTVSAIDATAGTLTINATATGGSGVITSWTVSNKEGSSVEKQSTTSLSIGSGIKTFTVATPAQWNRVGDYLVARSNSNRNYFMAGTVQSINTTLGTLTLNVTATAGSGSFSSWTLSNQTIDPVSKQSLTNKTMATGDLTFVINVTTESVDSPEEWNIVGDYVEIVSNTDSTKLMRGWVKYINDGADSLTVTVTHKEGSGTYNNWTISNLTGPGATFCNVTYSSSHDFSEDILTAPPLLRVAKGNYQFWSAGEVHQCLWEDEDPGGNGKNYNNPEYSDSPAAQDNPYKSAGLGAKDYVVRIKACVDLNGDGAINSSDGQENCKQYPYGNFKPIGLLQEYGDNDQLLFGMIAGTYQKSTTGGDMVMPLSFHDASANNTCREINLNRDCDNDGTIEDLVDVAANRHAGDGTFNKVYTAVGGPASKQDAEGVINTWSIYRIKGYEYGSWSYSSNQGDGCSLSIDFFGDSNDSQCTNWGNPFAEIYLTALRNWVGENAPLSYQASDANSGGVFDGLNYHHGLWEDPLNEGNYCAPLNVINFNSSVISADTAIGKKESDELDASSHGVVKDLNSPYTSIELTNQIGIAENISDTNARWFIGETSTDDSKICTAKAVPELGQARGLCPEGADLRGGYRVAGLAWYAHTNDIRPPTLNAGRALKGIQTVDTYSVRLASGVPVINIPVPTATGGDSGKTVTMIPSCIDQNKDNYGCTLVDFKILTPHYTETSAGTTVGRGKFMAIWEDSLQGSDYDLDAGGIYEYVVTPTQIKITTAVTLENLGYAIGHGYVISGTTQDGLHIHSGTNGFDYSDPFRSDAVNPLQGCTNCYGLTDGGTSSTNTYTIGSSTAQMLEDPLWYAAKWGGFEDKNGTNTPDLPEEWDSRINKTWEEGSDGIPDNYFYASHPQQLENALRNTFNAILERTSSGTAAAVVSSNVRGEGALFQAFYEPLKKIDGKEAQWIGTIQALWLDSYGFTRQDCSPPRGYDSVNDVCIAPTGDCVPNGVLDNYCVDQVIQTYYDEGDDRTKAKVFNSNSPDEFDSYSLQGVVTSYSTGSVTIAPNSMQGMASFDTTTDRMTLSPYTIEGTVISYDETTGIVTMVVTPGNWSGPSGQSYDEWVVDKMVNDSSIARGQSESSITFATNNALSFEVSPAGSWIVVGDSLRLSTAMVVGRLGESFSNWALECLDGTFSTGTVLNTAITLSQDTGQEFTVTDQSDAFTGCTMAKISTYNITGDEGSTLNDWEITNLETIYGRGTSTTSITLANSGAISFVASPDSDWLSVGDRVFISNYTFSTNELSEIGYLWNGREQLYLDGLSDSTLSVNRLYGTDSSSGIAANYGRYITTWIDTNLNGEIDSGEYRDFTTAMFTHATDPVPYGFFDVDDQTEAEDVVKYIRGIELSGGRSRTIKYDANDSSEHVMRLGDIIDSTPTVVSSPQEGFNLLYKDESYKAFRNVYLNRRVVIYAGGNDGLLHAFNGGFYTATTASGRSTIMYSTSGKNCATGQTAVTHPLGSELWAYAPYNLLSHLQWLKDPNYAQSQYHVYYMNAKPRVFDAKIFTPDSNHPQGWGTLLVVGMNLGGGAMEVDTNSDDPGGSSDNVTLRSAYVIFDITNPETAPQLLGEIPMPDNSFTTVYPAVLAFQDTNTDSANISCSDASSNCISKWYLQFGTGPNSMATYSSDQSARFYLFDLAQLTTSSVGLPDINDDVPDDCSIDVLTSRKNIITCKTGVANSFVGTPVSVDWNLDFYADTTYFGLVGDGDSDKGSLWKISFSDYDANTHDDYLPENWSDPTLFFNPSQPVVAQPVPSFDNKSNKWLFFGTGRYFANVDKVSTTTQTLYGIKEDDTNTEVSSATLLDVSKTEVYSDRSITDPPTSISGSTLDNFTRLESEIDNYANGWKLDLEPIVGIAGTDPSTRNFTRSALLGGVLFTSVFQPSDDPCVGEGQSRLYGMYYKTGTAYPGPAIFGTEVESVDGEIAYRFRRHLNLGSGVATTPTVHSGAGGGPDSVSVFTQLSTGDIIESKGTVVLPVRTGKTSWSDR